MAGWCRRGFRFLALFTLLAHLIAPFPPVLASQQETNLTGTLIISLQDTLSSPLGGGTFEVTTASGSWSITDEAGTGTVTLGDIPSGPATVTLSVAPDGYETGASVSVEIQPGESTPVVLVAPAISSNVSDNSDDIAPDIGGDANEEGIENEAPSDLSCSTSDGWTTPPTSGESDACGNDNRMPNSPELPDGEPLPCPDGRCDPPSTEADDLAAPMPAEDPSELPGVLERATDDPYSWTDGGLVLTVEPPANLEVVSAGSTILIPITVLNTGEFQSYLTVLLTSTSSKEEISGLGSEVSMTVNLPLLVTAEHIAAGAVAVPGITILDGNEKTIASAPAFSFPIRTPVTTTEITLGEIGVSQPTCEDGGQPPQLVLPEDTDQVIYRAVPDKATYAPGETVTVTASWDPARFTVVDDGSWEASAETPGTASQTVTFAPNPCPSLLVEIELSPDSFSFAGEVIRYDIVVMNTGAVPLSNLTLSGSDIPTMPTLLSGQRQVIGSRSYHTTGADLTGQSGVTLSATVDGMVEGTGEPISATGTATIRYVPAGSVDLETAPAWDEASCTDGVLAPPTLGLPPDTEAIRFSASDAAPYAPGQTVVIHATTVGAHQFGRLSGGWVLDETDVNRTHASYTIDFIEMPCQVPVKAKIEVDVSVINKQLEYGVDAQIAYAITVANIGNVPLSGVTVASTLSGDLACEGKALEPGKTIACTASYLVSQADVDAGTPIVNVVSVAGTAPDGATRATASDSDSVNVVAAITALSLASSANPVRVNAAGQQTAFTFAVTNGSNITLTGIAIDSPLLVGPSHAVTCEARTLAPGASTTCRGDLVVDQSQINDGVAIDVVSTATGKAPDARLVRSSQASTTIVIDREPGLALEKVASQVRSSDATRAVDSGEDAHDLRPGDIVTYRLAATNTGNVTLTDVIISDPALSSLACDQPVTLGPGETLTCLGEYAFTDTDATRWSGIAQAANATAQAPGSGTVTFSATATMWPAIPEPALAVEVSADRATYSKVGEVIKYSVTVRNAGTVPVSQLRLSATPLTGDLVCDLPQTLEPTASVTCTGTYAIIQDDLDNGNVVVSADAAGEGLGGKQAAASQTVTLDATQKPVLELSKRVSMVNDAAVSDPVSGLTRDDTVTYTLIATNTGNVVLTGVAITDTLADETGLDCAQPSILLPGSSLTCALRRTITQEDVDRGSLTSSASATAITPAGTALHREATTTVRMADAVPGIAFTAGASPDEAHRAGDVITWSFSITNTGNVTIGDITLQTSPFDAAAIDCPRRTVAPGATLTCTATSVITQDQMDAGYTLSIDASASGYAVRAGRVAMSKAPIDPRVVTSTSATARVRVVQAPTLTMTGTASTPPGERIRRGTVVTIEFLITNAGNTTVRDVIIEDIALSSVFNGGSGAPVVGTLAPGESRTVRGTVTLSEATMATGVLTDIAIATNGGVRSPEVSLKLPLGDPSRPTQTPATTPPAGTTPTPTIPSRPTTTPTPAPPQETSSPSPTDPARPAPSGTPAVGTPSGTPGISTPPAPGQQPSGAGGTSATGETDIGDMAAGDPAVTGLPSTGQEALGTAGPLWTLALMASIVTLVLAVGVKRRHRS